MNLERSGNEGALTAMTKPTQPQPLEARRFQTGVSCMNPAYALVFAVLALGAFQQAMNDSIQSAIPLAILSVVLPLFSFLQQRSWPTEIAVDVDSGMVARVRRCLGVSSVNHLDIRTFDSLELRTVNARFPKDILVGRRAGTETRLAVFQVCSSGPFFASAHQHHNPAAIELLRLVATAFDIECSVDHQTLDGGGE